MKAKNGNPCFGAKLPLIDDQPFPGKLIVLEGIDGSGRSTQISLLTEWLESEGFSVRTMGLRRSSLVGKNIDDVLARNVVTRLTLSLLYATDFFDQLEHQIIPALRAGSIVLADRYIFTLIARAAARGLKRKYLEGIYQVGLRPDLTFLMRVSPRAAFDRELKKAQGISYWESGRDMNLSSDLYESFIRYQTMLTKELDVLATKHRFQILDGEKPVRSINDRLRRKIATFLGIKRERYTPSTLLRQYWTE